MRTFSRDVKTTYYKYQSLPRNYTQQKRLKQLHTLKDNEVKVGIYKYSTNDDLGKGYSSKVYKGVQIEKIHKRYAIKVIELKKFRGSNLEMLEAEIQIHRTLVHDNVVRLYEVIKTPYFFYIVMEYCPHGNLHEYIKQKKKLTQNNALEIMDQVLAGSKYLMEMGIIHRDLKPANILRVGNKWKLSDFGFAVKSKYGFKDRINVGTPLYMSPQSLKKSYYSFKTDIFALGVILYEMIQGKTPWQSKNQKELMQKIKQDLVLPQRIKNQKIKLFINRCCDLNEGKRMSKEQIMQFQLFQKSSSEGQAGSKNESLLVESMTRAMNHSRRPSILSDRMTTEEMNCSNQIDFLYRQYLFAKHLYSCIRNIDSFMIQKQSKQRLVLTIFKLLLKLTRFLSSKKQNHFKLNNWQELTSSKAYKQLYQHIIDNAEVYQKQYLSQIKSNDIKNIRAVNKRFPDLCHHSALPTKFYYSLMEFMVGAIREHNHQLMLMVLKDDTKVEINNTEAAVLKMVGTSGEQIDSASKLKIEEARTEDIQTDSNKKYTIKQDKDIFPKTQELPITTIFNQPKKQSRLLVKRLSKRQSKMSQNKIQQDKKSNKNSQRSSTMNDKYQALQSLFTIFRISQLRGGHEQEKQIAIDKINVIDNFNQSKLKKADYLDLRRLLRGL